MNLFQHNISIQAHPDFIYMGDYDYDEILVENEHIFTNYDDYYGVFVSGQLMEKGFENNNYLLFYIVDSSCSGDIAPTDYSIYGDDINITLEYEEGCGDCTMVKKCYLLKIDKNMIRPNVTEKFVMVKKSICDNDW